jgi:hypothetical protein
LALYELEGRMDAASSIEAREGHAEMSAKETLTTLVGNGISGGLETGTDGGVGVLGDLGGRERG